MPAGTRSESGLVSVRCALIAAFKATMVDVIVEGS